LPNQSRSAKPAGIVPLSPSLAHFRTPTATRSNLHSARQPSYPTSRAFLHWRLSDDGPVRAAPPSWGRHPKPFTQPDPCTALNSVNFDQLCGAFYAAVDLAAQRPEVDRLGQK